MSKFRVGTRDSLLAVTQTQQVIDELECCTGHEFEMVTMKTTGDLDTSKPLWQMDGKNFFTKELDQALLDDKIDVTSFLVWFVENYPKSFQLMNENPDYQLKFK